MSDSAVSRARTASNCIALQIRHWECLHSDRRSLQQAAIQSKHHAIFLAGLPCSIPMTRLLPLGCMCSFIMGTTSHLSPRRRRQPRCTVAMLTHRRRWLSNLIVLHFASTMALVSEQCNLASISVIRVLGSAPACSCLSCPPTRCLGVPPSLPQLPRCNLVHLRAELLCCITMVAALSRCHPPSLTPPPDQPSRHMQDKPRSCRRHGSWRSCAADPMADDQPRRRALKLPAAQHHPLFSLPRTRNHRHQRGHFP